GAARIGSGVGASCSGISCASHTAVQWPMATPLPLPALHESLGARFGEADGYLVPLAYGDSAREHEVVREGAGLIDRSERGKIQVTGRDRASFFQGMLSNDVKTLQPGQGCEAAFLDVHGKIVALLIVHCLPDGLVLELGRQFVGPTLATLDRFLIPEKVELEDASGEAGILADAAASLLPEASLPAASSLQKGCYIGQEVLARITYRGHVNRQIVGFRLSDDRVPGAGSRVLVEGKDVGWITSAVVSPSLGRALALGYLRREHWGPGTLGEVEGPEGTLAAEVSALPFYRRSPAGG